MDNLTQFVYNWREFVTIYNLERALARKKNVRCKTLCYNGNWNLIEKCSLMEKCFLSTHHPSLTVRQFPISCRRPTVEIKRENINSMESSIFFGKTSPNGVPKLTL
jgi:hypothetical protein